MSKANAPHIIELEDFGSDMFTSPLEQYNVHLLFDDIDEVSSKEACTFLLCGHLEKPKEDLTLMISSFGGEVYSSFAITDMISLIKNDVITIGSGKIMSAGLYIFMSGTRGKRYITENCVALAHQHNSGFQGKYSEIKHQMEHEDYLNKLFIRHVVKNSTMTEKEVKEVLLNHEEVYLTPKELLGYGLADKIIKKLP